MEFLKHGRNRSRKEVGAPPGSFIHTGSQKTDQVRISLLDYDADNVREQQVKSIDEIASFRDSSTITWINIDGLHRVDLMEDIGEQFDIHPLIIEDVLNVNQRPKMEDHESYLFVILQMLYEDAEQDEVIGEQISLILGDGYVISFQESIGDIFDPIRERIRHSRGRIRKRGADYLLYALIDTVVDYYFQILERIGFEVAEIEEPLLEDPDTELLQQIYTLKQDLIFFRRSVWPLREVLNRLERGESELIKENTKIFFRDVYDHVIQVMDSAESTRDLLSGQTDLYLSSVSNRMNEVMKVLTIIGTIFIPLTFIAGVYGMNFKYMPELSWPWAYPAVMGLMMLMAGGMLVYFRKNDWI